MLTVNSNYISPKPLQPSAPLESLRGRVNEVVLEVMQKIARENFTRVTQCNRGNAQTTLSKGCFYPNEYCRLLIDTNQTTRLEWLKNQGSFYHGYASQKHFTIQEDNKLPTGKHPCTFHIKKGVKPSEGLDAIIDGLSLIGCGEACDIAYLMGIRKELGDEKFDALFAAESPTPLCISHQKGVGSPIIDIFYKCIRFHSLSEIGKGQLLYVTGSENYSIKHRYGEDQGFNVMCIDDTPGEKKFIGLGIPPEGVSLNELEEILLQSYNQKPLGVREILSSEFVKKANDLVLDCIREDIANKNLSSAMLLRSIKQADPSLKLSDEQMERFTVDPLFQAELLLEVQERTFQNYTITKQQFTQEGGGKTPVITSLHFDRIMQLKNAPANEGKRMLALWKSA